MISKKLKTDLTVYLNKQSFYAGIYLKDFKSGEIFELNGQEIFSCASVRKVPILIAAFNLINQNKVSFNRIIKIEKKFQKNRSGSLRYLESGSITLKNALRLMITESDNTCTGHVVDLIGVDYINSFCKTIGLKNSNVLRGFPPLGKESFRRYADTSTPEDIGFFVRLDCKRDS